MKAVLPLLCIAFAACDGKESARPLNGSISGALQRGMTEQQATEVSSNRVPDRIIMSNCVERRRRRHFLARSMSMMEAATRPVRPKAVGRFRGCQRTLGSNPVALTSAYRDAVTGGVSA